MLDKLTILGNGSSALLAAIAFSRLGISIDLFCNTSKKNDSNLVTFLSSLSLKYLSDIGINQLSDQKYETINDIECCYINKSSNKKTELKFQDHKIKPLGKVIPNSDLYDFLLLKVKDKKNISIIEDEISDINFDEGNAIVNLLSGKSYHTKLFIFTDSKNKFIHNFNKTDLIKKPFDQTALSIDANVKRSNQNTAYQFFTKDGPLALLPVNDQRCSFVWSLKDNSEILEYTKEQIEKEIYKYAHMYIDELNIQSINKHKLVFSFNKNMTYKNIIMLGESAHTVHPIAGQGFNLTLKDISTLYSVLDRYLSLGYELNHKFIFNDFYKQRILDNTLFSFSTMFMSDAFISKNNFINKSIETSFKILNRVPSIKKKIMKVASGREIF
jgi:2-polyprenyl-6-methoxyphenol hydroxylase-like FAD-dependent oxidoreductase